MKVSTLQLFLRSLQPAVIAAEGTSSLPAELEAVSAGLEPFGSLDFDQFAAFLRLAEQYRNSGAVPVPLAGIGAGQVEVGLRTAASLTDKLSGSDPFDANQITTRRGDVQRELQHGLAVLLEPLRINVTLKADKKAFEKCL